MTAKPDPLRRSLGKAVSDSGESLAGNNGQHHMLPFSYYDLIETFPREGCSICNLLLDAADRFLDNLIYERTNDFATHRAFRERRGLCNEHSWQATQYSGSSLSLAILFAATFDEVLKIVDNTPAERGENRSGLARMMSKQQTASVLADRLEPTGPCAVCEMLSDTEQRLVDTLCHYLMDPTVKEGFASSSGLCLPHFKLALRHPSRPENRQLLISTQRSIWARLLGELRELIAKSDHRRMHEPRGHEATSWSRGAGQAAGEKGVFGVDERPFKR